MRRFVRLHDSSNAEKILNEALARYSPENRQWVLRDGIVLYNNLFGIERALEFCQIQLLSNNKDQEISAMFKKLAEVSGNDDDVFSTAILREIAINFNESDKDSIFKLAYSYGEVRSFGAISFERYRRLGTSDKSWPSAPNNMGVIVGSSHNNVQIEYFEEAIKAGSGIAAANLARELVKSGYITRAEQILLEVNEDDFDGIDLAAFTDAKAKINAARQSMQKERSKLNSNTSEQDRRYKALIFSAFDYFKSNGNSSSYGLFISSDNTLSAVIDNEGANCRYRYGETILSARLPKKPLCFEGTVTGGTGLANFFAKRVLFVQASNDLLRAIVWPNDLDDAEKIEVIELRKVDLAQTETMLATDIAVEVFGTGTSPAKS